MRSPSILPFPTHHRYRYDAFGELEGRSGSTENSYLYAGEQFDQNLSKYYLRQRYYDTEMGRFTRKDSYEGEITEPITLHKYLYTHANPVNSTDPTGWFTIGEASAANSIRNILSGIQVDNGQKLVATTLGDEPTASGLILEGLLGLGILAAVPIVSKFVKNTFVLRAVTQQYKFFAGNEAVEHFARHGSEVMQVLGRSSYNLENYIDDANHVIKTGTWVPEMSGYVKIVGGSGRAKAAFVGVRRDNRDIITTFHVKSVREIERRSPSLGWH